MNAEFVEEVVDDFLDLLDLYQEIPNRPIYVLSVAKILNIHPNFVFAMLSRLHREKVVEYAWVSFCPYDETVKYYGEIEYKELPVLRNCKHCDEIINIRENLSHCYFLIKNSR